MLTAAAAALPQSLPVSSSSSSSSSVPLAVLLRPLLTRPNQPSSWLFSSSSHSRIDGAAETRRRTLPHHHRRLAKFDRTAQGGGARLLLHNTGVMAATTTEVAAAASNRLKTSSSSSSAPPKRQEDAEDDLSESFPLVSSLLLSAGRDVRVRDPARVESILARMVSGSGRSRLQVLADFDRTLTRVHRDGRSLECSWGVVEASPLLARDYVERAAGVKARYLPIEQNPRMSVEEKTPHIEAWYREANALLREAGARRDMFPKMVEAADVELREGTEEMFSKLEADGVPVLVLSAGLGDLLVEILRQRGCLTDNVKVVSNFMAFDEEGNVTGISGRMIHVFNKSESALDRDSPFFSRLRGRDCVLLLGDSLGDLQMSAGCEVDGGGGALLTVGFLNVDAASLEEDDERLRLFMDAYDVVLVDDQTMAVPAAVVDAVLDGGGRGGGR